MARLGYRDIAIKEDANKFLRVVRNPEVTVYEPGTTTPLAQTIYAGPTGGTTLPNPFVGTADGLVAFWLETAQDVKLEIDGTADEVGVYTLDDVRLDIAAGDLMAGNKANVVSINSTSHALTLQNTQAGGTGNRALKVLDDAGNTALEVSALGGGGPYEDVIGAYLNGDYGKLIVGNVRNWTSNSDVFIAHNRVTGSPTGSFVPLFVGYNAVTQPTDGYGGSTNVPDEVGISTVVRAWNTAAGGSQNYDGSLRAQEAQTLVFQNAGITRTYGAHEVGIHTALNQDSVIEDPVTPDNIYGSYGVMVQNLPQTEPGFGTQQKANFGVFTRGMIKHPFAAFADDGVTRNWSVDQNGQQKSGHILPRSGSTYNLGSPSASDFWSAIYGNFYVMTTDGSAGGPALTRSNQTSTGGFWISGGMGFSSATAEIFRYDASAFQMSKGERLTGVISPTALAANTDNYNPTGLSTARILRISASGAVNLTGITAPATGGTVITLLNVGANVITLKHEVTSTAANRFNLPSGLDVALAVHQAVEVWYDGTAGRWKALGAV